jgi:hypothetical protein
MGSGTTAVVACQFGRNYAGIDISENYVLKCKDRLKKLENLAKTWHNSGLEWVEFHELRRLFSESPISTKEVLESKKLIELYTKQFGIRMNNGKNYGTDIIENELRNLGI